MTDDQTGLEEEQEDAEQSRIVTLQALSDKVDSLAEAVAGLGRTPSRRSTRADDAEDVASQVRAEVGKLKASEQRESALDARIRKIEGALRKKEERPPQEYRKLTERLWGAP
jgi:hypothetical protein